MLMRQIENRKILRLARAMSYKESKHNSFRSKFIITTGEDD